MRNPLIQRLIVVASLVLAVGRELGPDALDAYTETKNVYFNTGSAWNRVAVWAS